MLTLVSAGKPELRLTCRVLRRPFAAHVASLVGLIAGVVLLQIEVASGVRGQVIRARHHLPLEQVRSSAVPLHAFGSPQDLHWTRWRMEGAMLSDAVWRPLMLIYGRQTRLGRWWRQLRPAKVIGKHFLASCMRVVILGVPIQNLAEGDEVRGLVAFLRDDRRFDGEFTVRS